MKSLFESGKFPVLDGLRAWAIILVLITHLLQVIPGLSLVRWNMELLHPLFNGWVGVDLFFVLSGYLVGGQIIQALDANTFSFKKFYLRRTFRILPAYFTCLTLFFLLQRLWPEIGLSSDLASVVKNFSLMTDYFPSNMGVPSWSLAIEEKFYLLAPLALLLLRKHSKQTKLGFLTGVFVLALVFRLLTYRIFSLGPEAPLESVLAHIYFPFHTRMDSLAMGLISYLLVDELRAGGETPLWQVFSINIGALLVLAVLILGALSGGLFETTLQYSLLALGFGLILTGARSQNSKSYLTKFLSKRIWTPFARLSYSIYLTHLVVIHVMAKLLEPQFSLDGFARLLVICLSCFFAAAILYFMVENPLHKWARRRF